jgi:methionine synthase II (cobalamin-independent)
LGQLYGCLLGSSKAAIGHIDPERIIAAPDSGLGMLDRALAVWKFTNLVIAVKRVS